MNRPASSAIHEAPGVHDERAGIESSSAVSQPSRRRGTKTTPLSQRWWTAVVVVVDAFLINFAFRISYWLRYEREWIRAVDEANFVAYGRYVPWALLLTAIILFSFKMGGVYSFSARRSWLDSIYPIISGTAAGIGSMIFLFFLYPSYFYSRLIFAYAAVLIVLLLSMARLAESIVLGRLRARGVGIRRVLIVGVGEIGRTIMRHIVARRELGFEVVGFVDDDPGKIATDLGRFKALGTIPALPSLIQDLDVDEVIVALPWMHHRKITDIVSHCLQEDVRALVVPDLFQMSLSRVYMEDLQGIPMLGIREPSLRGWNLVLKRVADVVLASFLLFVLAPLLFLIALAIYLESPGGALFRQRRVGRNGEVFLVYKFRSMVAGAEEERQKLTSMNEADGPLFKIRQDPRRTRIGRLLRRFSLDEMPQLYNVLRGEMSLVGPRPALPEEVARYESWHHKRLEVSPGLTGLWQISGRSELSFEEMCLLDIYYVEQWTPSLDLLILLKTIPAVIFGHGAY